MNDYCTNQWQRYRNSNNPEFLWRIASNQNWLTQAEEQCGNGQTLTPDRIAELERKAAQLSA